MKSFYVGNTYVEYSLSSVTCGPKKAIVFLLGIPGSPKEYEIFENFKSEGYDIFLPRYEGTWESKGEFLERAPSVAIEELLSILQSGILLEDGQNYSADNLFILGASFGGGVSLVLKTELIKAICALSPVISFKKVERIETLSSYLKAEEKENYRFDQLNWDKLISDSLYSPVRDMSISPDKFLIIAGKNDDQISYTDIEEFAKQKGISNIDIENTGHITFSRVTKDQYLRILNFFKSKI